MSAPKYMLCIPRRCRRLDERICITKGFPRFHNNVSLNRQLFVYPTVPDLLRGLRNSTTGMISASRVGLVRNANLLRRQGALRCVVARAIDGCVARRAVDERQLQNRTRTTEVIAVLEGQIAVVVARDASDVR